MNIKAYKDQSKSLTVTLRGGEELTVEYYPNRMTIPLLNKIEESQKKDIESVEDLNNHYVEYLLIYLKDVDLFDGDKKIPFGTEAQKRKALSYLTHADVEQVLIRINEDMRSETKKTSTDSADG